MTRRTRNTSSTRYDNTSEYPSDNTRATRRREKNTFSWLTPTNAARVFSFLVLVGLGFMILLNVQPWIAVAKSAAKHISVVPYFLLEWIPFIGRDLAEGARALIQPNITALMGITLWAVTQSIEVTPILAHFTDWEPPVWLRNKLSLFRALSYMLELIVCFLQYPPYQGGIEAFYADMGRWDFALIDFNNMVLFVIALFGVEASVWIALTILQALRYQGVGSRP